MGGIIFVITKTEHVERALTVHVFQGCRVCVSKGVDEDLF